MDKKLEQAEREHAALAEDIYGDTEESADKDFLATGLTAEAASNMQQEREVPPGDFFQYKHMMIIPNSQAKYHNLADKDTVLANYKDKKPDPDYHKILIETVIGLKNIFCIEVEVPIIDSKGEKTPKYEFDKETGKRVKIGYLTRPAKIFDENFAVIVDMIEGGHKFEEVASRAMGDQRAAILDRSQTLAKELRRKTVDEKKTR